VLPGCNEENALRVVEDVRLSMPRGQTASAGIATWDGREAPEVLVRRADVMLYAAKEAGRDRTMAAGRPIVSGAR
jgi:GGDEF domain-containing protein